MEEKKLTIQEEWLLTKKISVKYSTYCKYESVVTKHINPSILFTPKQYGIRRLENTRRVWQRFAELHTIYQRN